MYESRNVDKNREDRMEEIEKCKRENEESLQRSCDSIEGKEKKLRKRKRKKKRTQGEIVEV